MCSGSCQGEGPDAVASLKLRSTVNDRESGRWYAYGGALVKEEQPMLLRSSVIGES